MRWLQWSSADLAGGLGGVEVHARSLHREFSRLGLESSLSSDPEDLAGDWDVIQTHGSLPVPLPYVRRIQRRKAIRLHILHGSTLGRMLACRELTWPGGYLAYSREWQGVVQSDVIAGVQPGIHMLKGAEALGKVTTVCWNGWDSAEEDAPISEELQGKLDQFGPFFGFVGRGGDPMKNTDLLERLQRKIPEFRIAAIPGAGFAPSDRVLGTGRLEPAQIIRVLKRSSGLLLPSFYEGLPLVVLEALGHGIPVYSTRAGGLRHLSPDLKGLHLLSWKDRDWEKLLGAATSNDRESRPQPTSSGDEARESRAHENRNILWTWRKVAEALIDAVSVAQSRRGA